MKSKKLSIIIPAYNAEKYIEQCLCSLKKLMEDELEIIVINDGSDDYTADIVDKCHANDSRIMLITVENGGVSKARNIGLEKAEGEYIFFLDADDYLLESAFDKMQKIIASGKYDFAAFSRNILETDGSVWPNSFPYIQEKTEDKAVIDRIMFADSLFNECWGKLYRKSIIDKHHLRFPEGVPIGEDLMFVMKYYSFCMNVYTDNTPLVAYRQHGESAMRRYNITDRMKLTEEIFEYSKGFIPEELKLQNAFYNFKILTNLCREYSKNNTDINAIKVIYTSDMKKEVLKKLKERMIPLYRKHEYIMMKHNMLKVSAVYYHMKARV